LIGDIPVENILTIDVENLYHAEYLRKIIRERKLTKEAFKINLERAINIILKLLRKEKATATFFIVGETLESYPDLIDVILKNGHEVACHSYTHRPLWELTPGEFLSEIRRFMAYYNKVKGYRAPSFSLDNKSRWILRILEKYGFKYDSSIFPAKTPLYGVTEAPIHPYPVSYEDISKKNEQSKIIEFPLLAVPLPLIKVIRIPLGGGFYLRALPHRLIMILTKVIEKYNAGGYPAVLYFHPWEIEPSGSSRNIKSFVSRFITFFGTGTKFLKKIRNLLNRFRFTSIQEYMEEYL